jgi:phage FluMu protein Com
MFKAGQKVVCKNTSENIKFNTIPRCIKKEVIYEITDILKCPKCNKLILSISNTPYLHKWCRNCNCDLGFNHYYHSWRFEPIKYNLISNKEIIKELITEKSDLLIKEPILN